MIIKSAADKARFVSLATGAGVLVYGFTAVCWYFNMRTISLGQGAVFYSMLALITSVLIGAYWFGEAFGTRQVAGVGFAIVAMALMSDAA